MIVAGFLLSGINAPAALGQSFRYALSYVRIGSWSGTAAYSAQSSCDVLGHMSAEGQK
jgi:hypothetical protein